MLKIISDTTPILSLLKIGKLDLLKELYGNITVPFAVFQEIEKGREKRINQISWEIIDRTHRKRYMVKS